MKETEKESRSKHRHTRLYRRDAICLYFKQHQTIEKRERERDVWWKRTQFTQSFIKQRDDKEEKSGYFDKKKSCWISEEEKEKKAQCFRETLRKREERQISFFSISIRLNREKKTDQIKLGFVGYSFDRQTKKVRRKREHSSDRAEN